MRPGLGDVSPGPTEPTAELTTSDDGLGCRSGMRISGILDYAPGAKGDKATPVELARRGFSKKIEEDDKVVAGRGRNRGTVRMIRDGRTVAIIEYRRAGGGWLQDNYRACPGF